MRALIRKAISYTVATAVNTACGDYVFLAPLDPDLFPTLTLLTVNGKRKSVTKRDAFYVDHEYPRFGKEIAFLEGENEIIADFYGREGITAENIPLRLIKAEDPPSSTLSESIQLNVLIDRGLELLFCSSSQASFT